MPVTAAETPAARTQKLFFYSISRTLNVQIQNELAERRKKF